MEDIKTTIVKHLIDHHYDDVLSFCSTDNTFRKTCTTNAFWKTIYEHFHLPFTSQTYTDVNQWILEFHKTRTAMARSLLLIQRLKDGRLENRDDEENENGLSVMISEVTDYHTWLVGSVNANDIKTLYNNYVNDVFYLTQTRPVFEDSA